MRLKGLFTNYDPSKDQNAEKLARRNPKLWKKLKKQFMTGRQIAYVQANNGLDRANENILRDYFGEYVNRFLEYGAHSFPSSFNALEPFFSFNLHNSIIQLVNEEESYGVSLNDFLEFATQQDFDLESIDFYENIVEQTIYHFSFTSGFKEILFKNNNGKTFVIGSLSMVRRGNEVSILIQAGEKYNKKEAKEYFETQTRESLENSMTPYKKSIGLKIEPEGEPKVVNCFESEDLWLHSVAILFDIESKSIDIRNISRDENISYSVITDDFNAIFSKGHPVPSDKMKQLAENLFNKLIGYDAILDFSKYCLALPYYVFENEEKLVEVMYPTKLNSAITGPLSKRKFSSVSKSFKIFAKPFYFLESQNNLVLESKELSDKSFKIEKSGYWKRIELDEQGFDKKGRVVIGKTWVERNDIYYTTPKGITTTEYIPIYTDPNAGHVYIMRQPTHEEDIFKIGLTRRQPEKRKKQLSNTSNPDMFFIISKYYTRDCLEAEKRIHKNLEKYRLSSRREFFKCDLKLILRECESVTEDINGEF